MRTRSQARRRRQPQVRQTSVESSNLEKPDNTPIVTMADNRTMAQLLEAPTEGYEDAIVIPEITANNFEIKHGLLNLVQNKQFFGHDKEDPHAHIRYFNKITSTMKIPNVPNTSVKLMLFPFSLAHRSRGTANPRIWLEKEPPPASAIETHGLILGNVTSYGFSELHQSIHSIMPFKFKCQDSIELAALGGNFLDKCLENVLKIIDEQVKVRHGFGALDSSIDFRTKPQLRPVCKKGLSIVVPLRHYNQANSLDLTSDGLKIKFVPPGFPPVQILIANRYHYPKLVGPNTPPRTIGILFRKAVFIMTSENSGDKGHDASANNGSTRIESSVNELPRLNLNELPPHLEYAFLECCNDKLPVIIAKDLKDEEKGSSSKVLKSHKRAIAWKLSDIKGVSRDFCTHKILMEEDMPSCAKSREGLFPDSNSPKEARKRSILHMPIGTFLLSSHGLLGYYAMLPGQFPRCDKSCVSGQEALDSSQCLSLWTMGDTMVPYYTAWKNLDSGFYWPQSTRHAMTLSHVVNIVNVKEN
ncbi:hypothetical protein Tco_0175056 [Tanacetum coccineum]